MSNSERIHKITPGGIFIPEKEAYTLEKSIKMEFGKYSVEIGADYQNFRLFLWFVGHKKFFFVYKYHLLRFYEFFENTVLSRQKEYLGAQHGIFFATEQNFFSPP